MQYDGGKRGSSSTDVWKCIYPAARKPARRGNPVMVNELSRVEIKYAGELFFALKRLLLLLLLLVFIVAHCALRVFDVISGFFYD